MKPFITTYTGRRVNPLDLKVNDICIEDIAHHLACINRFVGALQIPVSVAQHSVYVARLCYTSVYNKEALFHDAAEAYLGDMSKWVKNMLPEFQVAEDRAWHVICQALHLDPDGCPERSPTVEAADRLMVRFEALHLLTNAEQLFEISTHPRPTRGEVESVGNFSPWSWRVAERGFLDHARMLGYEC